MEILPPTASILLARHGNTQDFSRLAFHRHTEWTTTNLAVSSKLLRGNARINGQIKFLTAKRTLDRFRSFHDSNFIGFSDPRNFASIVSS